MTTIQDRDRALMTARKRLARAELDLEATRAAFLPYLTQTPEDTDDPDFDAIVDERRADIVARMRETIGGLEGLVDLMRVEHQIARSISVSTNRPNRQATTADHPGGGKFIDLPDSVPWSAGI